MFEVKLLVTLCKDSYCLTAVKIQQVRVIISVLFCLVHTVLSLLSQSTGLQEDIHNQEQFREITAVISRQRVNEICSVCQASILLNFFRSSLLAVYKNTWQLCSQKMLLITESCRNCHLFLELLLHVFCLNITSAIGFTDISADGCENGHAFCKLLSVSYSTCNFFCVLSADSAPFYKKRVLPNFSRAMDSVSFQYVFYPVCVTCFQHVAARHCSYASKFRTGNAPSATV